MDTPRHFQPHYDAVIIGARCAGAATAMLLARAGMNVLAIDRQAYGSDTMSTHALMRTGVLQLDRWGLLPAVMAAGTPEIHETTFHYGCEPLRLNIKPEYGVEYLCAPRRTVLDRILVDAACSAGAEVRHGVVLSRLQIDSKGGVVGALLKDADGHSKMVRSDIVIGADGELNKRAFDFFDLAIDLDGRRVGLIGIANPGEIGIDAGLQARARSVVARLVAMVKAVENHLHARRGRVVTRSFGDEDCCRQGER